MSSKTFFVPLLRDENTWPKDGKIVFLDESFLVGIDDGSFDSDVIEVLENKLTLDYAHIYKLSYDIAGSITDVLNSYHDVQYPVWYWHKLMVQWLTHVIFSIYDKCQRIEYILDKYQHDDIFFQFIKCKNDIPKDFGEFYRDELSSDCHYLQAYAHILGYYDCHYDTQDAVEIRKKNSNRVNKNRNNRVKEFLKSRNGIDDVFRGIMAKIDPLVYMYSRINKPEVILLAADFSTEMVSKLVRKTKGRVQPRYLVGNFPSSREIAYGIREKVKAALYIYFGETKEKWMKILMDFIPAQIPYCFIEDYAYLIEQIPEDIKDGKIRAILTGTGLYQTFIRMVAMTLKVNNNVNLLAVQHGGTYGFVKYIDRYDYTWDDIFYIWGQWKSDFAYKDGSVKNAPSGKFLPYKGEWDKACNGVLFVGTELFLHTDVDHVYPQEQNNREYMMRQIAILSELSKTIGKDVVVRNYLVDHGWRINDFIKKQDLNVSIDDNPSCHMFSEELKKCRLLIVDHLSTTWLEALYIDKPFIVIVNSNDYRFIKDEYQYVLKMKEVGILRDLDTINEIGTIYENVEKWWNEPKRREVIKQIRDRYCFNQDISIDDMVSWWSKELLNG